MEFIAKKSIVLASQSPRRKELLEHLGVRFQTAASNVVENEVLQPANVHSYVVELARRKAEAVAKKHETSTVIGADTIVSLGGRIFPKPKDAKEANQFLKMLSGQTHHVITAVAIVDDGEVHTFSSETTVTFYELDDAIIDAYIQTGDCFDKAGAYGIQSGGLFFVKELKGDYYSVMGLPIARLSRTLQSLGVITLKGSAM